MTTTLRPAGPEERDAAGGRCREYDIRVNSRPVGRLRLAADAAGGGTGRILGLAVAEADRRRGRATVAVLAAEEVLRAWGCRRVEAEVPAAAAGALRLARALGYTEHHRGMARDLGADVPLPAHEGVLRAVTGEEYLAWLAAQVPGLLPELPELAGKPDRPPAAWHVLASGGADVGALWLDAGRAADAGGRVVCVAVRPGDRRRGHGSTLLREAERLCRTAGGARLGLRVSPADGPALRLCASLGYRPVAHGFAKPL